MAQQETRIQNQIRLALSAALAPALVLFRNHSGTLQNPRTGGWVTFGLGKGSPDLIGWKTRIVTPDMVGQPIAQFTGLEIKVPGQKLRPEQVHWLDKIRDAGGIAHVADSPEVAVQLLEGMKKEPC